MRGDSEGSAISGVIRGAVMSGVIVMSCGLAWAKIRCDVAAHAPVAQLFGYDPHPRTQRLHPVGFTAVVASTMTGRRTKQHAVVLKQPSTLYTTHAALVAGAGALGTAIAGSLLARGFDIFLVARDPVRLEAAARRLRDEAADTISASKRRPGVIKTHSADLTSGSQAVEAVQKCVHELGVVTVACCCAGEFPSDDDGDQDGATRVAAIEINICAAVSPILRRAGEGGILLTTSSFVRTLVDYTGVTRFLVWANAVQGLREGLTNELRQTRVRVCMLALGLTRSRFGKRLVDILGSGMNPELARDERNWIDPLDVGRAADWMLHPGTANGQISEMVLQTQTMPERSGVFNDAARVSRMIDSLVEPDFRDRRVALITGAGKGIGRGIALVLARAGFDIVAVTRTAADLDSLAAEIVGSKTTTGWSIESSFLGCAADITDNAALERAVLAGVARFGTLSCVVSNAGTNKRRVAALADIKTWQAVVDVDLIAAMNLTRLSLKWLLRHARLSHDRETKPSLVFVSSDYAHPKGVRVGGISPYIACKAATNAFGATVFQEVRDWGVGVTTLDPGLVATDLGTKPNRAALAEGETELISKDLLLTPEDCGRIVLYLTECSPACCVANVWVANQYHGYPFVRYAQAKYVDKMRKREETNGTNRWTPSSQSSRL